jgi:hypothetical protein
MVDVMLLSLWCCPHGCPCVHGVWWCCHVWWLSLLQCMAPWLCVCAHGPCLKSHCCVGGAMVWPMLYVSRPLIAHSHGPPPEGGRGSLPFAIASPLRVSGASWRQWHGRGLPTPDVAQLPLFPGPAYNTQSNPIFLISNPAKRRCSTHGTL